MRFDFQHWLDGHQELSLGDLMGAADREVARTEKSSRSPTQAKQAK